MCFRPLWVLLKQIHPSYIKVFDCSGAENQICYKVLAPVSYFARMEAATAQKLLSQKPQFAFQIYNVILADLNAQHAQQPVGAVRVLDLS